MILISAKLLHGSTYLAGEEIECELTFTNAITAGVRLSSDVETLAWATAQIHCQCTVNESRVIQADVPDVTTSQSTTFFHPTRGERGFTVMTTLPQILFCNIKLSPGEKTTYVYKETIPLGCVPTFRGNYVKYSYKLTVGTQRPDSPIAELKIPFRVLVVQGMQEMSSFQDDQKGLRPSNPFLTGRTENEHSLLDVALQLLAAQSCRKRQNCYNISNRRGKIAKLMVLKSAYKIGEDITTLVDFTEATVQCLQFSITLQCEEELSEKWKRQGVSNSNVVAHSTHQEFCLHMQRASISLPIPLHVTPTFTSDVVSLRWRLHIEFVTLINSIPRQEPVKSPTLDALWQGMTDLEIEHMHWDMPIKLLATSPLQCALLPTMKVDDVIELD